MESPIPKERYNPFNSQPSSPHLIQTLSLPLPYKNSPNCFSPLCTLSASNPSNHSREMAAISTAALSATALSGSSSLSSSVRRKSGVVYIEGLNSFGGLKAHNSIVSLGMPKCTEQSFAMVVSSLKRKRGSRGGALSSTCNAAAEIFNIAAIMNGLVLVGVAVGFVLLRVEASLEEAE